MKRVLLIRHGATAGNLKKQYIGSTDEPLCPYGQAQAASLAGMEADRIVVSPMLRTRQTAELAFPGCRPEICRDLREMDFGVFEGRTADEMAEDPLYRTWVDGGCLDVAPGGEGMAGFKARCCGAFLRCMADVPADSTTAFVVHGGVIMAILEEFSRPKGNFYDYFLPNCGYIMAEMGENEPVLTVVSGEKP